MAAGAPNPSPNPHPDPNPNPNANPNPNPNPNPNQERYGGKGTRRPAKAGGRGRAWRENLVRKRAAGKGRGGRGGGRGGMGKKWRRAAPAAES